MHSGHRHRLRQRFMSAGTKGMAEHEVLELLLTYAIPRADVNPLAHSLIGHFGSLRGVLDADPALILQLPGCGENTAALLSLVREIARLLEAPELSKAQLATPQKAGMYLRSLLRGVKHECVYALYLSANYRLLGERLVTEGTIDESTIYPRRIVEQAISLGAASVILAHNHPGGTLHAGRADLHATERIQAALRAVGMELNEHYVVSEQGVYGILTGQKIETYDLAGGLPSEKPRLAAVAEEAEHTE